MHAATREITQRHRSLFHWAIAPDRDRRDPGRTELLRHEAGVPDRNAKPKGSDAVWITGFTSEFLNDPSRPRMIGGQDIGQGSGVVSRAALPWNVAQVRAVVNAEVRKRNEILLVDRVPHAKLGGNPSVEVTQDVEAVGALGRGGHPQKLSRRHALQKHLVRRCSSVMELVDNHDVEMRRVDRFQSGAVETLDRSEDVFKPRGPLSADPQLSEARVAEGMRECRSALLQDLLTVCDEEQPVTRQPFAKARVVNRRNDSLASAGCGNEEVPVPPERARDLHLLK